MKIKKLLCAFISMAVMLSCIVPIGAEAYNFTPYVSDGEGGTKPISLYSQAVYMVNTDTGDVVVDINSTEARVPASLTKIMTAVVVLEQFRDDPDKLKTTYVSAGSEAFDELYGTGASTADIQPGEEVSYYDLLCALMIPSSCEAANIIAFNISDSITHFCDMMNEEAQKLGMKDSHFSNAHGLFANKNYTTCRDMAKLTQYAIDNFPVFSEIIQKPNYIMSPTDEHPDGTLIINTNEMLDETSDYYYSPVKGVKTGTLDEAGRCLVSIASLDGKNYMIVSMGAPIDKIENDPNAVKEEEKPADDAEGEDEEGDGEEYFQEEEFTTDGEDDYIMYNLIDHKKLYQWAFYHLVPTDFINTSSEITDVKVEFAEEGDSVNLKPADGFKRDWPDNIKLKDVKQTITLKENVVAPVEKGDVLGTLTLTYEGEELASVDLIASYSLKRSETAEKMRIAKSFTDSAEFKICIGAIIAMFAIYTILFIYRLQHKYVKKKPQPDYDEDEEE